MSSLKNTVAFNPRSISGCGVWVDAADPNGNGTSFPIGTLVSTWVDKSGNGRNATAQVAATYANTSSGNALSFTGSNYYSFNNFSFAVGAYFTFFIVERIQATSGEPSLLATDSTGANQGFHIRYNGTGNGTTNASAFRMGFFNNDLDANNNIPAFTTAIAQPTRVWSLVFTTSFRGIYLNGTLIASDTNNTQLSAWNTPLIGRAFFSINPTTFYYNGFFYELIGYGGQITTSQRQQVEGYLAWKWGTIANLPATHPFKQPIVPFSYPLQKATARFTQTFDPRSVAGLQMWLDAATSFSNFTNGQAISRWIDKTSNGWVGTAYNSPTYQTNAQNGLPVIRFNGTNQYIDFGNILNLGTNRLSIFAITRFVQPPGLSGYGTGIIAKSYYGAQEGRWAMGYDGYWSSGMYSFVVDGANAQASFAYNPGTQFNLFSSVNNRSSYNAIYTNGALSAQTNFSQPVNSLSTANLLFVGVYNNESGNGPKANQYLNGDIGEILVYFAELSTAQRQQVEGYLARKWGISLTASHPNANPLTLAPFSHAISKVSLAPTAKWQPTQTSNCILWLDGADKSKVGVSGSNITAWNDKSGLNNNLTTISPTPPTYNSRTGAITFTSGNGTSIRGALNATYTNPISMFIVCSIRLDANQLYNPRLINFGTNGTSSTFFAGQTNFLVNASTGTTPAFVVYANNGLNPTGTGINNQTYIPTTFSTVGLFENLSSYSGTTLTVNTFLNGNTSTYSSRTTTWSVAAPYVTSMAYVSLGTNTNGSTYLGDDFSGDIYEVVVFSRNLSVTERQQVEGYLGWKWRIQGNLPSTHPYAKFPPTP